MHSRYSLTGGNTQVQAYSVSIWAIQLSEFV